MGTVQGPTQGRLPGPRKCVLSLQSRRAPQGGIRDAEVRRRAARVGALKRRPNAHGYVPRCRARLGSQCSRDNSRVRQGWRRRRGRGRRRRRGQRLRTCREWRPRKRSRQWSRRRGRRQPTEWHHDRRRPWHGADRARQSAPLLDSKPAAFHPCPWKGRSEEWRDTWHGESRDRSHNARTYALIDLRAAVSRGCRRAPLPRSSIVHASRYHASRTLDGPPAPV